VERLSDALRRMVMMAGNMGLGGSVCSDLDHAGVGCKRFA
jgi:hypothetical protein